MYDDNDDKSEISLARLRLFLSPHTPLEDINDHKIIEKTKLNTKDDDLLDFIPQPPPDPPLDNELTIETDSKLINETNHNIINTEKTSSVRLVSPVSIEFSHIKYLLQISLRSYKIQDDIQIWDVQDPLLISQYENQSIQSLEIESWIPVNELEPTNTMNDVYCCGFLSPKPHQGIKITCGNILLDNSKSLKGKAQFVLCKVAIGKSFVVESEEEAKKKLPFGYNSYYINRKNNTANSTTTSPNGPLYYHEYVLNDRRQILPQYLVEFNYTTIKTNTNEIIHLCNLCEKVVATLSCKTCEALLCNVCDTEVHSANKLVNRHKRQLLKNIIVKDTKDSKDKDTNELNKKNIKQESLITKISSNVATCLKHMDIQVEYFCPNCCIPVCVHCKMIGDHSFGELANHRLISIIDAYETSLKEMDKKDPYIESRKDTINTKLNNIHNRINEINNNNHMIKKKIKDHMDYLLNLLNDQINTKLNILKSEELELIRQLEQIEWIEKYLINQINYLSPIEFLNAWNQHKNIRIYLRDSSIIKYLNAIDIIKPDICLIGLMELKTNDNELSLLQKDINNSNNNNTMLSEINNKKDEIGKLDTTNNIINETERQIILMKTQINDINHITNNNNTNILSSRSKELISKVKNEISKSFNPSNTTRKSLNHSIQPMIRSESPNKSVSMNHSLINNDKLRNINNLSLFPIKKKLSLQPIDDIWIRQLRHEMGFIASNQA